MKHAIFSISFLLSICLCGCASKTHTTKTITFHTPQTFGSRLIYKATKSATNGAIERPAPSEQTLLGLARLKDLGNELLTDIGGIAISVATEDGEFIEGIYFDPATFRSKQTTAYKKWRSILKSPRNCRLAEMYESEFSGGSILSLMALPSSLKQTAAARKKTIGCLVLPEYGLTFQLDPKTILTYLARGMHVFAVNYRGQEKLPDWKVTCSDALLAYGWFKARLKSSNKEMIIFGKSFGTGPAIYLGTQCPGSTLILERPFARMSDLCEYRQNGPIASLTSPFAKSFVEKYFRYPNEDWIRKVSGRVLFLESIDDESIQGHTERLVNSKVANLTAAEKKEFMEKYWVQLKGSHFGRFWGDSSDTWYSSELNQGKIDRFLEEL